MAREQWGSRIGVILAVAGSAVGLGNFLRFPGQAAQNGGGAFMLPYFISLLVLGIPLCWAEWTMGRYAGTKGFNSAPGIYTVIWRNRAAKYFGGLALLIPLVIYMYYVLIEAWCLGYAINYATGDLLVGTGGQVDAYIHEVREAAAEPLSDEQARAAAFKRFFANFVGDAEDGALLRRENATWLLVLAGAFFLNFYFIYRGVAKGIETLCKIAMPLMALLALIVLVRVLTLGTPDATRPDQSVINGLGFMWNPKPDKLKDPQTWLAASGQIFFSLSVGFGIIINYASYLRERDDVVLSGLTSSSMNEFFEVCLGGLITVPAAFIFLGMAAEGFTGSSFALGFQALPNVFAAMWGGRFFGFLWFLMLSIAAITSSVSMLQPVIAFFEEGFGLKRHASAAMLGLIAALGCGFVVYFSKDLLALDTFDFWVGSVLIFVLATVQAILYGWVFGIRRGHEEAHRGAHIRIPWFVQLMLKYVVPVYLLAIFALFCWKKLPSTDALAFELDATVAQQLPARNGISPELREQLAAQGANVDEEASVVSGRDAKHWTIYDKDGLPAYVLSLESRSHRLEVIKDDQVVVTTSVLNSQPAIDALQAGRIPESLSAAVAEQGIEVPADVRVRPADRENSWHVEDVQGNHLLEIRRVEAEGPASVLAVKKHAMGYVEATLRRPVVLGSMLFILVVLGFLMLMIHIAGRRWKAEGRFAAIDEQPGPGRGGMP
ncbi:MAG TPA: sodium-dependent transporter [Planctomycetaceae bacterium]|nr:sodium-dependent transporter [Planctomycetaceae bacterium]